MLGVRGDGTDLSEITDATVTYPTLGTVLNGRKRLRTSDDFTYVASTGTLTVPIINAGTHGPITCTTLHATGAATLDSTLDVDGTTTITDTLTVQGNYATALGGALGVTGLSSLNGGITVPTNKAVTIQGNTTLGVTGTSNLGVVNSGNTQITGTLGVSSDTTLSGTLGVGAAPGGGYTARVTGTLGVTGATTITGQLTANGTAVCNAGIIVPTGMAVTLQGSTALSVSGASTFAGGKFSGNVGVGGSSTNAFPVDMGNSSTVQKLALYNNSSVFYGFGVGNNCITGTAGAASGSSTVGGLVFTSNNQLGINTALNQADIGYNLLVGGTAGVSGAATLTGAVTCASTVTCTGAVTGPTYATNYSSIPSFTSTQIGYNTIAALDTTGFLNTYLVRGTLTSVPKGVFIISFLANVAGVLTTASGNVMAQLEVLTSGGTSVTTKGPWVINYNVNAYVAQDCISGTWTYSNNTATATINLNLKTTGPNTLTCDANSFLQITKIA